MGFITAAATAAGRVAVSIVEETDSVSEPWSPPAVVFGGTASWTVSWLSSSSIVVPAVVPAASMFSGAWSYKSTQEEVCYY